MNKDNWLKEGKRTRVTDYIKERAEGFNGEGLELIREFSNYIRKIAPADSEIENFKKENELRYDKRELTAHKILTKHKLLSKKRILISGCIAKATVFRTLCIARGIPAIYVETINERWLSESIKAGNANRVLGHIFVDVFVCGKWHTINPGKKPWLLNYTDYSIDSLGKFIVIAKGLDAENIGFPTMDYFHDWLSKEYNIKGV